MTSQPVAFLAAHLGVTKTHSRPTSPTTTTIRKVTSAPLSTARSSLIASAASKTAALSVSPWCNQEHRLSGIGWLTPASVHFGQAQTVLVHRQAVLDVLTKPTRTASFGGIHVLPLRSEVWGSPSCGGWSDLP
jgi:putative transposase